VSFVDVNVYGFGDTLDIESSKVSINFRIDVETREWGIKNISVHVYGTVTVPISISGINGGPAESKEVVVDLSKIKTNETTGNGVVTLGDLDLNLDSNFNVDYNNSILEIMK